MYSVDVGGHFNLIRDEDSLSAVLSREHGKQLSPLCAEQVLNDGCIGREIGRVRSVSGRLAFIKNLLVPTNLEANSVAQTHDILGNLPDVSRQFIRAPLCLHESDAFLDCRSSPVLLSQGAARGQPLSFQN